jgi:hypothetical protein
MPTKADRFAKLSPVKPRNAMHANSSFGYGSCWRPWDREGSDKGNREKIGKSSRYSPNGGTGGKAQEFRKGPSGSSEAFKNDLGRPGLSVQPWRRP